MSYLMMAIGDGNAAMAKDVVDASTPHMTEAGARSIRAAAILT